MCVKGTVLNFADIFIAALTPLRVERGPVKTVPTVPVATALCTSTVWLRSVNTVYIS